MGVNRKLKNQRCCGRVCPCAFTGLVLTTSTPPSILALNDDVLRQVAEHLLGKDALSFSLTSKHVYDLAIHGVSALIECKDRDKLRLWAMHRTLFYDNPERAKHIQKLIVRGSVFPPEELYGSDDEQWDEREVLESPVAPLIVDLLRIACNIRCLTIESFDTLCASDPGVVAAMTALRRLSKLELFNVQPD
ncbi:hypothetical protein GSI_11138 [Ganoderma sinense ZZ0214-1]|uniref:F-box domain-containing protein n=1 Tax=Ganoderma sinense ZZ0214-1 TaxID=1077348 RepID=A0A2G8RZ60_9APHY|nr:hypothetical protein GSI_11138 [Ganoderma sinense ZZ0214-1]